jgi:hypothetical protein
MFDATNLKTSEKKVTNVRPKFKFIATLERDHFFLMFLRRAEGLVRSVTDD